MACTCSEASYNFAAGPSPLPADVRVALREALVEQGPLEQPFGAATVRRMQEDVEQDLRTLLQLPDHYHVLFLQGGASAQFALLPLNLLAPGQSAGYLESGHWARKAIAEARRHAPLKVIASGAGMNFRALPPVETWQLDADMGYCHVTSNETGDGLQLHEFPELPVPLVADMSSDFLTRPLPLERFGLIYASAQKNLGIAGLCLVIVRDDLLRPPRPGLPSVFSYALQAEANSRLNTPPLHALHCAGSMLRWIARQGGLAAMEALGLEKSRKLYRCIDDSDLYLCPQHTTDRSRVNVCFQLREERLLPLFLSSAERHGLLNLHGHPALGGVRASLYNAMPLAGVDQLVEFMTTFERQHG